MNAEQAGVDELVERADDAFRILAEFGQAGRARMLRAMATALDAHTEELVALAAAETALGETRLRGELVRTTFQLRFFADVVSEGSYLRATIDRADPAWPPGARPDLRRVLLPVGPVLVFAASNFPFAFSVAGGDTASALAAGCTVVLKCHPGHPELSARTADVVRHAAESTGAPADVVQLLEGEEAGRRVLSHPLIRAAAFTGSLTAGRALFDVAAARPEPIPFFGEMGSLNPVFVTESAALERAREIAEGFAASFTLGAGQFCTKPGLLAVPESFGVDAILVRVREVAATTMLTDRIAHGYRSRLDELRAVRGVRVLIDGTVGHAGEAAGAMVAPSLLVAPVDTVLRARETLLAECFGPVSIVVTYRAEAELVDLAGALDGQLTATIHSTEGDAVLTRLVPLLAARAGRVIAGGWPTGVAVSWAMQHGGPYPATTSAGHTSVGPAAIDRFLRAVTYQSMPAHLLPAALRDDNPLGIPRLVDGRRIPAAHRGADPDDETENRP